MQLFVLISQLFRAYAIECELYAYGSEQFVVASGGFEELRYAYAELWVFLELTFLGKDDELCVLVVGGADCHRAVAEYDVVGFAM